MTKRSIDSGIGYEPPVDKLVAPNKGSTLYNADGELLPEVAAAIGNLTSMVLAARGYIYIAADKGRRYLKVHIKWEGYEFDDWIRDFEEVRACFVQIVGKARGAGRLRVPYLPDSWDCPSVTCGGLRRYGVR